MFHFSKFFKSDRPKIGKNDLRDTRSRHFRRAGFTLIEIMTSVAIIAIITAVVTYNHSKFDSDIEITNVAYRIALAARQAQAYGISVRQFSSGGSTTSFSGSYGLHFKPTADKSFIFFADVTGPGDAPNGKYTTIGTDDSACVAADVSGVSECVEKTTISRNIVISKFCGLDAGLNTCNPLPQDLIALDIMFKRPNLEALFNVYSGPTSYPSAVSRNNVCGGGTVPCSGFAICLRSPHGREKKVTILSTGQISVENVNSTQPGVCSSASSPN